MLTSAVYVCRLQGRKLHGHVEMQHDDLLSMQGFGRIRANKETRGCHTRRRSQQHRPHAARCISKCSLEEATFAEKKAQQDFNQIRYRIRDYHKNTGNLVKANWDRIIFVPREDTWDSCTGL